MNWKYYWDRNASLAKTRLDAVQRKDFESTRITASHIVDTLDIVEKDTLLDLCCGNGIITEMIAEQCYSITGIDQSEVLIKDAKDNNKSKNVRFIVGDVMRLSSYFENETFNKIYLQFSFQYFDKKGLGKQLIKEALQLLDKGGKLFIGDIPDKNKLFVFYNTIPKLFYLITSKLRNKNPMGKFWKKNELYKICEELNVKGHPIKQSSDLPYSWYRFDFLITK